MLVAAIALFGLFGLVLVSYAVEAMRVEVPRPDRLSWAPAVGPQYADIDGIRVRYVKMGSGPTVVLLHTLRTQLDIFHRVTPALAENFTVYAYDYPGHGWSDIPPAEYAPEDFYRWTAAFLEALDIADACIAGISIGGTIALALAARGNPRIARVIAINPYDYPPAGGIRKSSLAARLILGPAGVPVLGATLMRLRNRFVSDRIMLGGVADAASLSSELRRDLYEVGARRGHYQAFLRLLGNERRWADARKEYPRIAVPALVVYGERDWAPPEQREVTRRLVPGSAVKYVAGGGHFLCLDRPDDLIGIIVEFVGVSRSTSAA